MRWVTRERPKIDRVACPWLIERFIDSEAEFLLVSPDDVSRVAHESGAIPFDVEGVELSHDGQRCSSTRSERHTWNPQRITPTIESKEIR